MASYLPNTINSVLFILYGLFGMGAGLLLLDGYVSFGSFSPPSGSGGTTVPRGVDVGIGMAFLTMGALGIAVGLQLWKSRIAGLVVGLPLLLGGMAFAGFFVSVEQGYREFNGAALFLGLDVVMVILAVASWRRLRLGAGSRGPTQTSSVPNRGFTRLAAAIVVAAVLISASVLSYTSFEATITVTTTATLTSTATLTAIGTVTYPSTVTTTSTQTIPFTDGCNVPVWNGSSSGPAYEHTPVLLMRPNTTAFVCVTYQSLWQGNDNSFYSDMGNITPYLVNGSFEFGPFSVANFQGCSGPTGGASCKQIIYNSFQIAALPDSVRPNATMDYLTVIYSITAPSNSTDFYDQSAPWIGCDQMPMAVGYSASQVNASDFTQAPVPECPVQPFTPVAESATGMGVTYVNLLS